MDALLRQNWFRSGVATLWGCLASLSTALIVFRTDGLAAFLLVAFSAFIGYAIADLVSGVIHSLADHYGTEHTPFVGALFIGPFREHHPDPDAIAHESPLALCVPAMLTGCPPLCLGLMLNLYCIESSALLWVPTLLLVVPFGGVLACITHRLAHQAHTDGVTQSLQRLGVILSPEAHRLHHQGGHYTQFCILNGCMNRFLDGLIEEGRQLRPSLRSSNH